MTIQAGAFNAVSSKSVGKLVPPHIEQKSEASLATDSSKNPKEVAAVAAAAAAIKRKQSIAGVTVDFDDGATFNEDKSYGRRVLTKQFRRKAISMNAESLVP